MKFLIFVLVLMFSYGGMTLAADDHDHDEDHIHEKYYHEHDGIAHDLTMALLGFEQDRITKPGSQLQGRWYLGRFETTDPEMLRLVQGGAFAIWLDVAADFFQVSVNVTQNNKTHQDPPLSYHLDDGKIVVENQDFQMGLKGDTLILTMLGMDEAYRYTFIRRNQ